jgi:2-dehydropantoate 2-reductase
MKITIAGAGAMGCRFGAALAASGHDVRLLDGWEAHVAAINDYGLRVTDERGTRAVRVPAALFPAARFPAAADVPPADLVIVFAKATATAAVAAAAAGAIGPATRVLTLQNGLGNIEALLPYVPRDRLLAGTTTLGTELVGPGHIRALGSGETVLGELASGSSAAQRIAADFSSAGLYARASADVMAVIWAKVAFNCVMNSLCTIASIPVSALARYPGFDDLAGTILAEVAAVAAAEGVRVDTGAALALMKAQFDPAASGNHLASTLQDLLNGRPTEIAHLNGAIASRAVARGLAAPANTLITQLVGLLEATHDRRVTSLRLPGRRSPAVTHGHEPDMCKASEGETLKGVKACPARPSPAMTGKTASRRYTRPATPLSSDTWCAAPRILMMPRTSSPRRS